MMKPFYLQSKLPGYMRYRNNGIDTTAAYTTSVGSSIQAFSPAFSDTKSDFKKATHLRFEKTVADGLRGRCYHRRFADPKYNGPVERTGGFDSPLGGNGRIPTYNINWDRAYQLALGDINDKIRGGLDLSIDVFQSKEMLRTADRIFHAAKTIRDTVNRIRRGGGRKVVDESASYYLEWTYGVGPLIADAYALYNNIFKRAHGDKGLIHFRGRGKYGDRSTKNHFMNIFTSDVSAVVRLSTDLSVRCQIDLYLSPETSRLQDLSKYTSLNPVAWAYELASYSFVVDWLWDFGSYLRNLETALIMSRRVVGGCDTYTALETTTLLDTTVVWGDYTFTEPQGKHLWKFYERWPRTTYPVPTLPSFFPDLGARRLANAVALLLQAMPEGKATPKGRRARKLATPVRGYDGPSAFTPH